MNDHITTTSADGVLTITMNRPDKKNALTGAMYEAMIAAIDAAEADSKIGALLLRGAGGLFTAGNDIADFLSASSGIEDFPALRFIRRFAICDKPIVAAVDGAAVGVGTTILFHCDLIYAAPDATFRMPFVDLGLVPEAAASLLIPERVGMAKASEWLLLGEGFDATEAYRLGLINAIVDKDRLQAHALDKARALAAKPRTAVATTRRLMRGDRDTILDRMGVEARAFGAALKSDEARAAFMAFMAKAKK
ncbi:MULTISPECIES: enoyl-CoA hydratase-related protein [unclassified Beijerinckia]|uniref:enoyl-CoA hydratase-related protein n=1 Tax=unclassified Beijerinckia TaxID=2638183 RepID=UPI00089580BB|nr:MULTISPECIES: enoyl-CoA hydratase-related protein [unclassified Beijerinckia]MDH7796672.1 enoyl-CoA hydratase/carnithine racemase [Beijerinckia sp. GAS462]SEC55068.1 Enoyl-CoA hydratase/carnithine racemase [Beijerinckia sp. 28-YEA-48]